MNKALRNAIEKAEKKANEPNIALQAVNKYLTFKGFNQDDKPELSMCSGDELILEWHGGEIDRNTIIDYMENVGYISPDDFLIR